MRENFAYGQVEADRPTPSIASETAGASYKINPTPRYPERGEETHPVSYLMPSVHYRNGNMERVNPAIVQTPLGDTMPNRLAIAPAIALQPGWTQPVTNDVHGFEAGAADSWPEGSPVPISVDGDHQHCDLHEKNRPMVPGSVIYGQQVHGGTPF